MSGSIPRILEFPDDNQYWRVDSFGSIIRNHNVPSEPFFQLIITPYLDNNILSKGAKELTALKSTNGELRECIELGVGQLPFIEVGSIWRNGILQPAKAGVPNILYGVNTHQRMFNL